MDPSSHLAWYRVPDRLPTALWFVARVAPPLVVVDVYLRFGTGEVGCHGVLPATSWVDGLWVSLP
jgi:hypothetical protein